MAEQSIDQSTFARAWQDTLRFHRSFLFWFVEAVSGVGSAVAVIFLTPVEVDILVKTIAPIAAFPVGGLTVVGLLFAANWAIAPYRQRNEARTEFQRIANIVLRRCHYPATRGAATLQIEEPNWYCGTSGAARFEGLDIPDGEQVIRVSAMFCSSGIIKLERPVLRLSDNELDALDWKPDTMFGGVLSSYNFTFCLPKWIRKGEHSGELLVYAGNQWWRSDRFSFSP